MISWKGYENNKRYIPPGFEINWIVKNNIFAKLQKSVEKETRQARLVITAAVFTCSFFVIVLRLLDLMVINETNTTPQVINKITNNSKLSRSDIYDRNGWAIASTVPTINLYANPSEVSDPYLVIKSLEKIYPDLDKEKIIQRLHSNKKFIYLKRHVTPQDQIKINNLGIPGLNYEMSEKRVYPFGRLFSHVIGTTDLDNKGTAGIEAYFNKLLSSGRSPLMLSLDVGVQDVVHQVLSDAYNTYNAIGGVAVVMDSSTSEIISLVSLPDFDPSYSIKPDDNRKFNRATLGRYEMGSTFKLFTLAMAIETNSIDMGTMVDARNPITISGYEIDDFHPKRQWLSVPEVLMHSSNIGATQIVKKVGSKKQKDFLEKIGLLSTIDLELPEVGRPDYPKRWAELSAATISYGHGIAVTPLHIVSGVNSLINGGLYTRPSLIKKNGISNETKKQVISYDTSMKMRYLMHLVVKSGSGKGANLSNYLVGGKTGSADKPVIGGYSNDKLITSFVGVFPIDIPRYVLSVLLDEPQSKDKRNLLRTSGWNAVPTAKKIISRIAPILNVYPPKQQNGSEVLAEFIKTDLSNQKNMGVKSVIE